ncbi:hypothetical protein BJV82DRAFT_16462 [Fennellomyces sp. T-0311]|nr:hypothetical protein BJV82DRAFT_16462 [Fennellomyces sp. T-0311]
MNQKRNRRAVEDVEQLDEPHITSKGQVIPRSHNVQLFDGCDDDVFENTDISGSATKRLRLERALNNNANDDSGNIDFEYDHGQQFSSMLGVYSLDRANVRASKRTHQQRLKALDESWAKVLTTLAIAHINGLKDGAPQYDATKPFGEMCGCSSAKSRDILCVYLTGIHKEEITFCNCRSDAETLVRHHLFPASPTRPGTAFHLTLLEFYRLLQATGHLAAQAFATAIGMAHKFQVSIVILLESNY